jgi:hypothetical protein
MFEINEPRSLYQFYPKFQNMDIANYLDSPGEYIINYMLYSYRTTRVSELMAVREDWYAGYYRTLKIIVTE